MRIPIFLRHPPQHSAPLIRRGVDDEIERNCVGLLHAAGITTSLEEYGLGLLQDAWCGHPRGSVVIARLFNPTAEPFWVASLTQDEMLER